MANFPFFNFPYNNYYNYYSRYNSYTNNRKNVEKSINTKTNKNSLICESESDIEDDVQVSTNDKSEYENRSSKYNYYGPIRFNFDFFSDSEKPIIEIMGIKLYLDDLIIIGLLFVLYQEGVKDEILFISLILLLLS
ncbi:MAG: hypothetical protein HFJ38_07545 [Bacilli bacterium]|nr:hypothetical protein [Bacilli bacterium]